MQPSSVPPSMTRAAAPVAGSNVSTHTHRSAFLPLLILMLALAAWTGYQTFQLSREREALATLRANQEQPLLQAQRVRQTLDQLATETQKLADAGNANARTVVEELRKRGVTINRPAQAPADKK